MVFIFAFCIIVVLIGVLTSLGKMKYGLEVAFVLIFIFSALRYDYGNDYSSYKYMFSVFASVPDIKALFNLYDGIWDKYQGSEIGWALLNWLFRPLGFNWLIVFTSLITTLVYYKFIRKFVPVKWYWLAVFTYMFNTNLFFVPLSMMRQSLAMVLFVWAFQYIYEKKLIQSVAIIFLATQFHKSALVLLPFAFSGFFRNINTKIVSISYAVLFVLLFFTKDLASGVVESAMALSAFENYEEYFEAHDSAADFGIGFVSRLITMFIPILLYLSDSKSTDKGGRSIAFIAGVSFLIALFTQILDFFSRFDYYFLIFNLAALPVVYSKMKNETIRYGLLALYIVFTLYTYNGFFANPIWKSFTHYQTILGI